MDWGEQDHTALVRTGDWLWVRGATAVDYRAQHGPLTIM